MNLGRLFSAFEFAKRAHEGQKRKTGEPYITHLVETSQIAEKYGADEEAIIACLLHDTVEDCGVSLKEIEKRFGGKIASPDETYKKIDDYCRKDSRVVLVKLCDRIHNTKTLFNNLPSLDKTRAKYKISNYNYIRLGKKYGYYKISKELEKITKYLEEGKWESR